MEQELEVDSIYSVLSTYPLFEWTDGIHFISKTTYIKFDNFGRYSHGVEIETMNRILRTF